MVRTPETKVLTAHMPILLAEKVDQIAARLERSRDWIVKQALSAWIHREEKRRRQTREAMTEVDIGQVIDHREVQTWAESLSSGEPLPVPDKPNKYITEKK